MAAVLSHFELADVDRDGRLSFDEFAAYYSTAASQARQMLRVGMGRDVERELQAVFTAFASFGNRGGLHGAAAGGATVTCASSSTSAAPPLLPPHYPSSSVSLPDMDGSKWAKLCKVVQFVHILRCRRDLPPPHSLHAKTAHPYGRHSALRITVLLACMFAQLLYLRHM